MAIDANNNDETDDVQVANDKLKTRLIIKSLFFSHSYSSTHTTQLVKPVCAMKHNSHELITSFQVYC